jgi:hypothetical protein
MKLIRMLEGSVSKSFESDLIHCKIITVIVMRYEATLCLKSFELHVQIKSFT